MKKSFAFLVFYLMLTVEVRTQFAVATYPTTQQKFAVGFNNGTVITAGNKVIEITTDKGLTWIERDTLPLSNITSLAAADINKIYITDQTFLFESTNSGQSWQQKTNTGGNGNFLFYSASVNDLYVYGGAVSGIIKKSTDGGQSFVQQTLPACKTIKSMFFINGQTGYAGDNLGKLLKTTNGGGVWTVISTPQTKPIMDISFVSELTGYLAAGTRNIFKTTDGGLNWLSYEFPADMVFKKIQMFSNGKGYICTENDIYKSVDGSASWIKVEKPNIRNKFLAAYFLDENNGIFAGNNIYRFDNSGTPAVFFDSPLKNGIFSSDSINYVSWFSSNVASANLSLFFSSDDGQTWKQILTNLPPNKDSLSFLTFFNTSKARLKLSNSSLTAISPIFTTYFQTRTLFSPNEISHYVYNVGITSYNSTSGTSGLYWPKNAVSTAVFQDGILWAGLVGSEKRAGGSAYRTGLQPGNILSDGSAANLNDGKFRIWQLKKNWQLLEPGPERDMYELDFSEWPAEIGAPYTDINGDGIFTRGIDQPKIIGDMMLWYVANDLDSVKTKFLYGALPMGIEMQVTEFAFNSAGLKDVLFKKVKLFNKGNKSIKDFFTAIWSDPDLGDGTDDYVGCDTTQNLAYVYNGDNEDVSARGYGANPPSLGYFAVQTPVVAGTTTDSAFFDGRYRRGYKALNIAAFNVWINSSSIYKDPVQGHPDGSEQLYNQMNGLRWDGGRVYDPWQINKVTKFMVPGDPVAKSGWYEGPMGWPGGFAPGDRRMLMSFGPRNFKPGDTMEFVYAY
ncbi:MAG: hypothetical protein HYV28_05035, partial [Ignavibacteriales bacterium]|nr:hypothetical protein [Ignavibacteriales bacterium]